ncbi:hypothetical protein [Pseudomonas panipatensis]|uniref:hypothetical protein n=1 Tax=Pseudomonas panipatensis TaxID=428992 RepID=UPI0035ADF062
MPEFTPLSTLSQPYDDVFFINRLAPVEHLLETAERRLSALLTLLRLLEDNADQTPLPNGISLLSGALSPMLAEVRQLYELAHRRPGLGREGKASAVVFARRQDS